MQWVVLQNSIQRFFEQVLIDRSTQGLLIGGEMHWRNAFSVSP